MKIMLKYTHETDKYLLSNRLAQSNG